MKNIALSVAALLLGTSCLAGSIKINPADAGKLGTLGNAFKQHESTATNNPNNVDMVYGGEDVSRMPNLALRAVS